MGWRQWFCLALPSPPGAPQPMRKSAGNSVMPWQPRHHRLLFIALVLATASVAVTLMLLGLQEQVTYFYTPSQIQQKAALLLQQNKTIRLGGLVEQGSVVHHGTGIRFSVTDLENRLTVTYQGIPPDLFRAGQGVVAEGTLSANGTFTAQTLLAKHDETYMPPEIAKSLKQPLRTTP